MWQFKKRGGAFGWRLSYGGFEFACWAGWLVMGGPEHVTKCVKVLMYNKSICVGVLR